MTTNRSWTPAPRSPRFPAVTYDREGRNPVYNCPEHGPMQIDNSGGHQSYECAICGWDYDPERD